MGIKNKIGNFFIKNSNSYNFYKNEYEKQKKKKNLDPSVEEEFIKLKNDFNKFKEVSTGQIESANFLFKTIFLDYELNQPKGILKNIQDLSFELLVLISNICKEYEIEWWLDYGNLLGAVRHGNFIPWDDNVDIGMTRKEYLKFLEIIPGKIAELNLDGLLELSYKNHEDKGKSHAQIIVKDLNDEQILSTVDIFPYDFLNKKISKKQFNNAKTKFSSDFAGNDLKQCIEGYYEENNMTFDQTDLLMLGIESNYDSKKPLILKSKNIFPLSEIEFRGKVFACPNDTHYYLKSLYNNYMVIPLSIERKEAVNSFRYNKNAEELFNNAINNLKEVNEKLA